MPMREKKKGGGSKLNRTQTVTLRLDPKLRYLTDLAARSQRRTTSGFIEWAIEIALKEVGVYSESDGTVSLADISNYLWDVEEPDRFLKLALGFPNLLTHHEQMVRKLSDLIIPSTASSYDNLNINNRLEFYEHWDELNAVAAGDADRGDLMNKLIPFR